jgi:hypothetical protein
MPIVATNVSRYDIVWPVDDNDFVQTKFAEWSNRAYTEWRHHDSFTFAVPDIIHGC